MGSEVAVNRVSQLQREVISGISSGMLTILITHPLDLVKVRLQLSKDLNPSYRTTIQNTILAPLKPRSSHYKKGLFKQLYKGLTINLLGNSTSWGLYFFLYRYYKDTFSGLKNSQFSALQRDKAMNGMHYLLAAWSAGFTTTVLTNPIWVLKTRIMSPNNRNPQMQTDSIFRMVSQIYKVEGITAFFRGLLPAIIGVSQGAIYFSIYDSLKVRVLNETEGKERRITAFESISITSVSKMTATLLLYPIQTLKSNMQDHGMEKRNLLKSISTVYKRNDRGFRNFYRGLGANLARSVPATCITFYTYETVKHMLP